MIDRCIFLNHVVCMKVEKSGIIFFIGVLFLMPLSAGAQSLPTFSHDFWSGERDAAQGKIRRGTGLAVLGLASAVPSAVLLARSVENPDRYLAWGAVMGIATIGMTGHGFGSVGFGLKQKRQAERFMNDWEEDGGADPLDQRDAWLHDQRKSTVKVSIFGSVLVLQSAILLTNGFILTARKNRGADLHGATIWPSFVVGGVLLPIGVLVIVRSIMRYRGFKSLETSPLPVSGNVAVAPWFEVDRTTGSLSGGLVGSFIF